MRVKNYILIGVIIFTALIAGYFVYQKNNQTPQTTFSVFHDNKHSLKNLVSIDNVDTPLDKEEACVVAKKSCNSPSCLSTKTTNEVIQQSPTYPIGTFQKAFGDFNLIVELAPVCGPTTAYIIEDKKEVICFCAYE